MRLSPQRKHEIAWRYLVHWALEKKGRHLTVHNLHKEVCGVMPDGHGVAVCCWDFVNDLVDRAVMDVRGTDEAVAYRLGKEERERYAYDVLLRVMLHKSMRIGTATKRDVGNLAAQLDIARAEALAFARILLKDLVALALD